MISKQLKEDLFTHLYTAMREVFETILLHCEKNSSLSEEQQLSIIQQTVDTTVKSFEALNKDLVNKLKEE